MAIAGGASPAYEWIVIGDELVERPNYSMTTFAATNIAAIVDALSRGTIVYVSADVREAARAALRQQGVRA